MDKPDQIQPIMILFLKKFPANIDLLFIDPSSAVSHNEPVGGTQEGSLTASIFCAKQRLVKLGETYLNEIEKQ
jgi:hypothetical protein